MVAAALVVVVAVVVVVVMLLATVRIPAAVLVEMACVPALVLRVGVGVVVV